MGTAGAVVKGGRGKGEGPLTSDWSCSRTPHVPLEVHLPFTGNPSLKSPPPSSLITAWQLEQAGTPPHKMFTRSEQQYHQLVYQLSQFLIRICKTGFAKALLLHPVLITLSQSDSPSL